MKFTGVPNKRQLNLSTASDVIPPKTSNPPHSLVYSHSSSVIPTGDIVHQINDLRQKNDNLRGENDNLRGENNNLRGENDNLRGENNNLQETIESNKNKWGKERSKLNLELAKFRKLVKSMVPDKRVPLCSLTNSSHK